MGQQFKFPPFPNLVSEQWDTETLHGQIVLNDWLELQAKTNRDVIQSFAGHLMIAVELLGQTPPTPEQTSAYCWFDSNAKSILSDAVEAIFEEYDFLREDYVQGLAPDQIEQVAPALADARDLACLISPASIRIHRKHYEGVAYISLSFDCTWDPEHGECVVAHPAGMHYMCGDSTAEGWHIENDQFPGGHS